MGTTLPGKINKGLKSIVTAKKERDLAQLLTRPDALSIFRQLVREPAASARAQALTLRLLAIGNNSWAEPAR